MPTQLSTRGRNRWLRAVLGSRHQLPGLVAESPPCLWDGDTPLETPRHYSLLIGVAARTRDLPLLQYLGEWVGYNDIAQRLHRDFPVGWDPHADLDWWRSAARGVLHPAIVGAAAAGCAPFFAGEHLRLIIGCELAFGVFAAEYGHLDLIKRAYAVMVAGCQSAAASLLVGALRGAATGGHIPTLEWLRDRGFIHSLRECSCGTAARAGQARVIRWLGPGHRCIEGAYRLSLAATSGDADTVAAVVALGSQMPPDSVQYSGQSTEILDAIWRHDPEVIQLASFGIAAEAGDAPAVEWVIRRCAGMPPDAAATLLQQIVQWTNDLRITAMLWAAILRTGGATDPSDMARWAREAYLSHQGGCEDSRGQIAAAIWVYRRARPEYAKMSVREVTNNWIRDASYSEWMATASPV